MRIGRLQAFLHLLQQIFDLVLDLLLEHRAHLRSTESFENGDLHTRGVSRLDSDPPRSKVTQQPQDPPAQVPGEFQPANPGLAPRLQGNSHEKG